MAQMTKRSSRMSKRKSVCIVLCFFACFIIDTKATKRQVLLSSGNSDHDKNGRNRIEGSIDQLDYDSRASTEHDIDVHGPNTLARSRNSKQQRNETLNEQTRITQDRNTIPVHIESVEEIADQERRLEITQQGSSCGRHKICQQREEMKSLRVEMIKQNLLTKLKMSAPPNITRPPMAENSAPILELMRRYAIDVEQGVTELDSEEEYVDSERVILPAKPLPFESSFSGASYFNFSEQQRSYSVHSAFLNFYVQPVNTTRTSALIQLQRYVRRPMSQFPPRAVSIRFIRISINNSSQGSYRKIRVTGLATGWLDRPSTNLGINIISTNIPNLIMTQSRNGVHNNKPFLDVKLVQRARHRRRRSAAEGLRCDANSTETRCCRYDLDVDFVSVGWDWIIFPRNYNARYCAGECGYLQLSDTRKQLIRHLGNTAQMPATVKNCCVGKRMVPISMLYYDNEGNIIYSKVPDMEIIKCACL